MSRLRASFLQTAAPGIPHTRQNLDYKETCESESHFWPKGDLGYFFEIPKGQTLPAGTLLGSYFGEDNHNRQRPYQEVMDSFVGTSDCVLCYSHLEYVVAGADNCGPARTNEGFETFNYYLTYNKVKIVWNCGRKLLWKLESMKPLRTMTHKVRHPASGQPSDAARLPRKYSRDA